MLTTPRRQKPGTARAVQVVQALLMMGALPPLTLYLWISVNNFGGELIFPASGKEWTDLVARVPVPTFVSTALYCGWLLLQGLLQIAAPGKIREGLPLADGARLRYKMNGWFSFSFTLAVAALAAAEGWISPAILHDQFGPLLTTVNLFAFAFSFFLYGWGKASPRTERRSGNALYDYLMGTALNPRIRGFDLKLFCESRPGLILWVLVDF